MLCTSEHEGKNPPTLKWQPKTIYATGQKGSHKWKAHERPSVGNYQSISELWPQCMLMTSKEMLCSDACFHQLDTSLVIVTHSASMNFTCDAITNSKERNSEHPHTSTTFENITACFTKAIQLSFSQAKFQLKTKRVVGFDIKRGSIITSNPTPQWLSLARQSCRLRNRGLGWGCIMTCSAE